MTLSEDRAKAREALNAFRNKKGELDVRQTVEETFIIVHGMDKRLEKGDEEFQKVNKKVEEVNKKVDRCPVPRGEMTFEQAHRAPRVQQAGLHLTGKQFILLLIIVVLAASGGAALAAKLGGL